MNEDSERSLDDSDNSKQLRLELSDWLTAYTKTDYSDRVHPDKRIEPVLPDEPQVYRDESEYRRLILEDVDYGSVTFNQGAD